MDVHTNQQLTGVQESVLSALQAGRLPHAILLEGASAQARMHTARWIAQAVLCEDDNPPCGQCRHCSKILQDIHPDLITVSGTQSARSFHADMVRSVRADAYVMPNESPRKVYILEHVHSMTTAAQNALLKVLEEPPAYVTLLLLCPNKNMMLPTILSRASVFALGEPAPAGADAPEETHDAQQAGTALLQALLQPQELALLQASAVFAKDKTRLQQLLPHLRERLRDALRIQQGLPSTEDAGVNQQVANVLSASQLLRAIDCVRQAEAAFVRNENYSLLLAQLSSQLFQATH